jgi:hypothetical protein
MNDSASRNCCVRLFDQIAEIAASLGRTEVDLNDVDSIANPQLTWALRPNAEIAEHQPT